MFFIYFYGSHVSNWNMFRLDNLPDLTKLCQKAQTSIGNEQFRSCFYHSKPYPTNCKRSNCDTVLLKADSIKMSSIDSIIVSFNESSSDKINHLNSIPDYTPCDNDKWCVDGECVHTNDARVKSYWSDFASITIDGHWRTSCNEFKCIDTSGLDRIKLKTDCYNKECSSSHVQLRKCVVHLFCTFSRKKCVAYDFKAIRFHFKSVTVLATIPNRRTTGKNVGRTNRLFRWTWSRFATIVTLKRIYGTIYRSKIAFITILLIHAYFHATMVKIQTILRKVIHVELIMVQKVFVFMVCVFLLVISAKHKFRNKNVHSFITSVIHWLNSNRSYIVDGNDAASMGYNKVTSFKLLGSWFSTIGNVLKWMITS